MARLDPDHEALLCSLVEASRSTSKRESFVATRDFDGERVDHPGLPGPTHQLPITWPDLDFLLRYGLIIIHTEDRDYRAFSVSPEGIEHYQQIREASAAPLDQLESEIRKYLESEEFRRRHGEAFDRWRVADKLLWASEVTDQYTEIGHHCREAVQAFAGSLLAEHQVDDPANGDVQKTVMRIRAVIDAQRGPIGKTVTNFLDALLNYFRSLCELVVRQEHGAQREGEGLDWEDARRVVFQTAVVLFEVDRALARIPRAPARKG